LMCNKDDASVKVAQHVRWYSFVSPWRHASQSCRK
jgi:hypothetical protein